MPLLQTNNLQKRFDGVHAVDHLSLGFEAGKITSIVGPNGSGKSTLVNTLTGMLAMDGGEVIVDGAGLAGVTGVPSGRGGIHLSKILPQDVPVYGLTRTFQDVRLFEQMPVIDNILVVLTERAVGAALFEKHGPLHLERAEAVLQRVGLFDKRHELAKNLSYGQRKLLEIARVLAMLQGNGGGGEINLIFFDEPFAGLFPEMVKTVISVMKELRDKGKAIVLIEHNMDIIRELSDHLYVLDAGKLLASGTPDAVLSRKDVIEAYLGE